MIFTRIIYSAILVGVVTGALLSVMQVLTVDPIIFASESYEVAELEGEAAAAGHDDHGHSHSHDGWGPEDGAERTFYTVLSNMSAGIGFAAILLALMSQFSLPKIHEFKVWQGLLWGAAGFTALYLAPGIGMPPEIPGIQAAPVEDRQVWWALTAVSVAIGLGIIAFTPLKLKAIGVLFLAIPYLVGAPPHITPAFVHPDPAAVTALESLHQQFIVTSGIVNLLFWAVLGLACAFVFSRWFKPLAMNDESATA